MQNTVKLTLSVFLALLCLFCQVSCGGDVPPAGGLWENAVYTKDTSFGEGERTLAVEVAAGDKTVVFTIKTNESTVGAAMIEHNLLAGEQGAYGLYVKAVNGIVADYDIDQSYWAFYINGEFAMTGVDATEIKDGEVYRLEYTK